MRKKDFRYSKTVEEFMEITGVNRKETILDYLILAHKIFSKRMRRFEEVSINLKRLGFTSEDVDKMLAKLDFKLPR